jgi:hypothetical protein
VLSQVKSTYNKNIMVGILLAEKALLKSPYVKRYVLKHEY